MNRSDYRKMVVKLSLDNEHAVSKMQDGKGHLVHMVLGIVGEVKEVAEELVNWKDSENLVKELGDLLFYVTGAVEYGIDAHDAMAYANESQVQDTDWVNRLAEAVKKYVMYSDASKWPAVLAELKNGLSYIQTIISNTDCLSGMHIDDIAQANYEKLSKRFGDKLEFTEKAAIAKADRVSDDADAVYAAAAKELPEFSQAGNLVKSDDYEDFGQGANMVRPVDLAKGPYSGPPLQQGGNEQLVQREEAIRAAAILLTHGHDVHRILPALKAKIGYTQTPRANKYYAMIVNMWDSDTRATKLSEVADTEVVLMAYEYAITCLVEASLEVATPSRDLMMWQMGREIVNGVTDNTLANRSTMNKVLVVNLAHSLLIIEQLIQHSLECLEG